MRIKRTQYADQPKATVWVHSPWWLGDVSSPMSDTAFVSDYPTHSPILGVDGRPLEYESRPPVGFNLKRR